MPKAPSVSTTSGENTAMTPRVIPASRRRRRTARAKGQPWVLEMSEVFNNEYWDVNK